MALQGYKFATLSKIETDDVRRETRVESMDKEFLRQIDEANEMLAQNLAEKLDDDVLICECFCVNVRDIREACEHLGRVDLELLRKKFSLGEGCKGCLKSASEWVDKIF